jgi:hypothetical protein
MLRQFFDLLDLLDKSDRKCFARINAKHIFLKFIGHGAELIDFRAQIGLELPVLFARRRSFLDRWVI